MPLTYLEIGGSCVFDLSPLKGMRLTYLSIGATAVSDLSPLEGMPLTYLGCNSCGKISDLSPLRGMPLEQADFRGGQVTDLSPLRGMPLRRLFLGVPATDLSPLRDCKDLTFLDARGMKVTEAEIAALQKTLRKCKIDRANQAKPASPR